MRSVDENGRLLHRSLWEQAYGPIPPGWEVHHVDGDKHHNEISNLVALPALLHRQVHDDLDRGVPRPAAQLMALYHHHKARWDKLVERQRRLDRELEYYRASDVWHRPRLRVI